MKEPKTHQQPRRAATDTQASVLAYVRSTVPAEQDDSDDSTSDAGSPPTRFEIKGSVRNALLIDGSTEYCIAVLDEEAERVWEVAVWLKPPGSDFTHSHCLVVGSKNQARDVLGELTGTSAKVSKSSQTPTYFRGQSSGGGVARKPGRTQQKKG